jgi:hypothetical protein
VTQQDQQTRPRVGKVTPRHGEPYEVRFDPHPERPGVFLAYHEDGRRAFLEHGDSINIDQIAPGQSVAMQMVEP